jgi:hypothetical protein
MAAAASSGGEQIDDLLDRCIGTMIGRFEPAIGSALSVGLMVEAAVGEETAQALVKEEEQESDLDALCREAVGIAWAVSLELAQIVAQLVGAIALLREPEGGEHSLMDLLSLAVQPPTCVPPCKRTSISLMRRVSWILMPG